VAFILLSSLAAFAGADKKDKPKTGASQTVDTGTFGIFIKGQRVVNETFSIEQREGVSSIKSQLKEAAGANPASQKSDLEITASGELIHYDWSQSSGGSLTVLPKDDFLMERISTSSTAKPAEKLYLMPSSTSILDNNFFVHREVLIWRYLSAACKTEGGSLKCQSGPAQFGVLVPQDQTSVSVKLEMVGREKVKIGGAVRDLLRLNLAGENFDWALWVDDNDHYKLIRVAIPADNTEVVRD
jgi:hypothetical protein